MIIIGGMGSLPGSLVGAALWLLLPSVIAGFAAQASGSTGIVRVLLGWAGYGARKDYL
jgi:ABC-type branched-subunit amino acid transport system permease subunit